MTANCYIITKFEIIDDVFHLQSFSYSFTKPDILFFSMNCYDNKHFYCSTEHNGVIKYVDSYYYNNNKIMVKISDFIKITLDRELASELKLKYF